MGRTVKDITIKGRTADEVTIAIQKWFKENGVKEIENKPLFIKGRLGLGFQGGARYFQVSLSQIDGGVVAHTEGWVLTLGSIEQDFTKSIIIGVGMTNRRHGWILMERLWGTLEGLTK